MEDRRARFREKVAIVILRLGRAGNFWQTGPVAQEVQPMAKYYFDIRENDELAIDDLGIDFPDLQAAAIEAAQSLADTAEKLVSDAQRCSLAIEVRNGDMLPLFKVSIAYAFSRH
jgi:hypothetical protein